MNERLDDGLLISSAASINNRPLHLINVLVKFFLR